MTTVTHTYSGVIAPASRVRFRLVTFADSGEIIIGPGVAASATLTPAAPGLSVSLTAGTTTAPSVHEVEHDTAVTLPAAYSRRVYIRLDGTEGASVALGALTPYSTPEAARSDSGGGASGASSWDQLNGRPAVIDVVSNAAGTTWLLGDGTDVTSTDPASGVRKRCVPHEDATSCTAPTWFTDGDILVSRTGLTATGFESA